MAGTVHSIKQGDTDPACRALLLDVDGTPAVIGLTDVVTWRMRPQTPGLRSDVTAAATVNDGATGDVEYRFTAADTAVPGLYNAEFHIAYASGKKMTFPTDGYVVVEILEAV